MPQILNANDLPTGDVVYWTGTMWVRDISEAELIENTAAAETLGKNEVLARRVLDPYLVDVTLDKGFPWPVRPREQIRATGPTVRADLSRRTGA
jgi:tartrate dehydratase beta subunit/fumarate hydratase class I family protein